MHGLITDSAEKVTVRTVVKTVYKRILYHLPLVNIDTGTCRLLGTENGIML